MTDMIRRWGGLILGWLAGCVPLSSSTIVDEQPRQSVQAYLDAGDAYRARGETAAALDAYHNAHTAAPTQTGPLLALADTYQSLRYYGQAADALAQAVALDPQQFTWRRRYWALQWLRTPPLDGAQRQALTAEINAFINQENTDPDYLLAAYKGARYIGDQNRQIQLLARLAAIDDPHVREQTRQFLHQQLLALDDMALFRDLATLYTRHFPASPLTPLVEDVSALIPGREDSDTLLADVAAYRAAAATDLHVALRLATALLAGDLGIEEVIELGQQSLAALEKGLNPPCPGGRPCPADYWRSEFHHLLGLAFHRQQQFDAAQRHFETAVTIDPLNALNHYGLGRVLLATGRPAEARRHFQQALRYNPLLADLIDPLPDAAAGHAPTPPVTVRFTDITTEANLANIRVHQVAWGDYNNDGYDDLLLEGKILFQNTGNGGFINAGKGLAAGGYSWISGGVWSDIDNDGYLDIFAYSNHGTVVLRNDQAGGFIDVTPDMLPEDPGFTMAAAAWGDLDNDGFLDVIAINRRHERIFDLPCHAARVLRNEGGRRFIEMPAVAGTLRAATQCLTSLRWVDLNDDAFLDLITTGDPSDRAGFWLNDGNLRLTRAPSGFAAPDPGVDANRQDIITPVQGDFDGDGQLELLLRDPVPLPLSRLAVVAGPDLTIPQKWSLLRQHLLRNDTTRPASSGEAAVADMDNDGDLDLVLTGTPGRSYSRLYLNDGTGRFTDATYASGLMIDTAQRVALADFDLDGDVDVLLLTGQGLRLLRNDLDTGSNWLALRFFDRQCNRFAVGARIRITGASSQWRQLYSGGGLGSQDSATLHVGLGSHDGTVTVAVTNRCGHHYQRQVKTLNELVIIQNGTPESPPAAGAAPAPTRRQTVSSSGDNGQLTSDRREGV